MSKGNKTDSVEPRRDLSDRWWVDSEDKTGLAAKPAAVPIGERFFKAAEGYEQDGAQGNLSGLNLKLLKQADPGEGEWGYVPVAGGRCPEERIGRLKRQFPLPRYARGVLVDCDGYLRLMVTGTPLGERVLELSLGEEPAFDCWLDGEWVSEAVFANEEQGIAALRKAMRRYLSPEGEAG